MLCSICCKIVQIFENDKAEKNELTLHEFHFGHFVFFHQLLDCLHNPNSQCDSSVITLFLCEFVCAQKSGIYLHVEKKGKENAIRIIRVKVFHLNRTKMRWKMLFKWLMKNEKSSTQWYHWKSTDTQITVHKFIFAAEQRQIATISH